MGHSFCARIWFNIEKQLELEMFWHLKRRIHCSAKPHTICGTPMQQKHSTNMKEQTGERKCKA
jgi:hypothetical protein